jgi:uncharacterized protein YydD (DUF2326 family)
MTSHAKLEKLRGDYALHEEKTAEKKRLQSERQQLLDELDVKIFELQKSLAAFEDDLKKIHEYIYGNTFCHFNIKVNDKKPKQFLAFDYRTDLDGGASSDRIKTFIYDVLLMLNSHTSQRHPGFLIHDNVFAAVGRNDMVKALNYLNQEREKGKNFQYIVTLNKDEFDAHEHEFDFQTNPLKRIELTRQTPLLGTRYTELD